MYLLILKSSKEIVGRISSSSASNLEEAKLFFMARKQMKEKAFNKIYEVEIKKNRE